MLSKDLIGLPLSFRLFGSLDILFLQLTSLALGVAKKLEQERTESYDASYNNRSNAERLHLKLTLQ